MLLYTLEINPTQEINRRFVVPGLLQANVNEKVALNFVNSPIFSEENSSQSKVLFKIRLDRTGIISKSDKDFAFVRSTCMLLPPKYTFRPEDEEVLFLMPQFVINGHKHIDDMHIFYLQ